MPRTARTLAVATPALAVVAAAWLRLEQPLVPLWRPLAIVALALAAAVPHRWSLRLAAAVVAAVVGGRIAVGVWLVPTRLDPGSGFGLADAFSNLGTRFGNGFADFYGTHLPFEPGLHTAMGELVLAGLLVFAVAVAQLAAARKPVLAALGLLVGAGWPATLIGPSHGIAIGAAILAAELVVLGGLGSRRVPALALPAAAVVATAAVTVGTATAARHGLVHWQSWNLAHVATGPVGVSFVWNAQYNGLKWPAHPTVVLQVQSKQPPTYLRAAVLDDFTGNAWVMGLPRQADGLEPVAAFRSRNQTPERVTVDGLADTQLPGGSIPVRYATQAGAHVLEEEPGLASLDQDLPRGFRYTVWSYTARPTVAELRRSPPAYPAALSADGLLDVGGVTVPRFGTPHRQADVLRLVGQEAEQLGDYRPLLQVAEQVAGHAPTPYEAVSRLEEWFVASGGFRYSNHPAVIRPAPLVGFVTQTKAGYCQYFAGAMALMLRYLGIPARVAVGFAGGRYDASGHDWLVTDREAHAWVEVWFKGYGWLPFDPTPAAPGAAPRERAAGGLPGGPAPREPDPFAQLGRARHGRGAGAVESKLARQNGFLRPHAKGSVGDRGGTPSSSSGGGVGGGGGDRSRPVLLLLLVLAAAGSAIVLLKLGFRMTRSVRRDPRAVAAACREELASFLLDQRMEAPRSATLRELGEIVKREFGISAESFVAAATAARFGPARRGAASALAARRELHVLLGDARRSLTWRDRLRGLLSLRSLARPAPVDASAEVGTGVVSSA
jgi:hypothetical protein